MTKDNLINKVDQFVSHLEDEGFDLFDILDVLTEYIELCEDVYDR
ncbi:hypothetical protein S-CBP42_0048 [Synechococcus phage S-CBP42]|nr:hypothetical protein AVU76_gp48 [Synechococcus phage S-CBP42]AGK86699.1 hypothetical protein S-CBP42_0048 [Synechococcus phage S-CBP42]